MQTHRAALAIACLLSAGAAPALDVTLDAGGAGSVTLFDTDLDHVIDFDESVGGVFYAKGRVVESIGPITTMVTLTATPPDAEGIFRNVGMADNVTLTVTINTTSFPATGTPFGWNATYFGRGDDTLGGTVDIPAHSVSAFVGGGNVPIATLTGKALTGPALINIEGAGVQPNVSAADLTVAFTFVAGQNDQIRLPDNSGFDGDAIEVRVFNQLEACIFNMNDDATRVALLAGKHDAKCVNDGKGTDATACVDDPNELRTDKREQRLLKEFAEQCNPVPAWGVEGETCCEGGANDGAVCASVSACPGGTCVGGACISAAAEDAVGDLTHDIFGAAVLVAADKKTATCQARVVRRASKLLTVRWRAFRKCKKDHFSVIQNDVDLVSVCLGPPQTDPKDSIARELGRLAEKVQSVCLRKGISPVADAFPGRCAGSSDADFDDCVAARAACRFCQAANRSDAIDPPLDCDAFDGDGPGSCPP
jgi:hypothetical protein